MIIEKWGRRVLVGATWALLNYTSYYLQPFLGADCATLQLLINKSAWVAGALVLGLTAVDTVKAYREKRNGRRTVASK